jgi:hypothetical protein
VVVKLYFHFNATVYLQLFLSLLHLSSLTKLHTIFDTFFVLAILVRTKFALVVFIICTVHTVSYMKCITACLPVY